MTRFPELRYAADTSAGNDPAKLVRTRKSLERRAGLLALRGRVDPTHGA